LKQFPDTKSLAKSNLQDVLIAWSGLGYNRRAKYLHEFAKDLNGTKFPRTINELTKYKGIGSNTAAAILVYSFNLPHVFIETNIRTVLIDYFYQNETQISDKELLKIVELTIDKDNPREWYWALMDYGAYLKKSGIKNTTKSKQYTKQSKFEGSARQIRGRIIKLLAKHIGPIQIQDVLLQVNDARTQSIINELSREGLVELNSNTVSLP
jgi:A/G-specific adenine glycosylase